MTKYADLFTLPEAERIRLIGEQARAKLVGILLEKDEPEKIARYIRKVTKQFKDVRHIDTTDGPTSSTMLVRFGPVPS